MTAPPDDRPGDVPPSAAGLTPEERLAQSRARIREFLERSTKRRRRAEERSAGDGKRFYDKLLNHPVAAVVIEAVTDWWQSHPLNAVASAARTVIGDAVGPLVRRYPIVSVGAAVVAGALVVRFKPWRIVLKSALFAGFVSQVTARVISQVPVESLIDAALRFATRRPKGEDPAPEAAAGQGDAGADPVAPPDPTAPTADPAGPAPASAGTAPTPAADAAGTPPAGPTKSAAVPAADPITPVDAAAPRGAPSGPAVAPGVAAASPATAPVAAPSAPVAPTLPR